LGARSLVSNRQRSLIQRNGDCRAGGDGAADASAADARFRFALQEAFERPRPMLEAALALSQGFAFGLTYGYSTTMLI